MPPLDDAYLEELLNTQFGGATANQLMGGGGAAPPPAPPQGPDPETTAPYADDTPPPPSSAGPGPGPDSNEAEAAAPWQDAIESAGSASPTLSSSDTGVDYFNKIEGLQKQGGELIKGQRENAAEMLKAMRESNSQMAQIKPPQLQKTPEAPKAELGRGMLEFAQIATVLGAMAGGLGRRNTTAALNAFAGAITGFAQGNKEVFNTKLEEWKTAAEQVKADNQAKLDEYDLIWKNNKMTMDQKLNEFKIVAAQYGDEITYNLAEQRNYMMLAQAQEKEHQWQMSYDLRYENSKRAAENAQFWQNGYGRGPEGALLRKYENEYQMTHGGQRPDFEELTAKRNEIIAGVSGARSGGVRAQNMLQIIDTLDEQAPDAIKAANKVLSQGKTALSRLNTLDSVYVTLKRQKNDPDTIEFLSRNLNISENWAKAMNPTGVVRQDLQEKALGILNQGLTTGTYGRAIKTLEDLVRKERAGVLKSLKEIGSPNKAPEAPAAAEPETNDPLGIR